MVTTIDADKLAKFVEMAVVDAHDNELEAIARLSRVTGLGLSEAGDLVRAQLYTVKRLAREICGE